MDRARATAEEMETPRSPTARVLESANIRVEVVPELGGKFISLRSKRTSTEWLLPPLRPYATAKTGGGFEEWDGGGFDECLPTVAPTETAPDHGEVWRHVWREEPTVGALMSADDGSRRRVDIRAPGVCGWCEPRPGLLSKES